MRDKIILIAGLAAIMTLGGCQRGGTGTPGAGQTSSVKAAPEAAFSIPTLEGAQTSLNQYKGKVVLVNFWATWCEPCQAEIPFLIQLNDKYGPQGLVILGVAMDDEGKKVVEPYVKNHQFNVNGSPTTMNYPILLGNDDVGSKFGGQEGLPTSYLYDRGGRRIKTIIGSILSNKDGLTKTIETQLGSQATGD